MFINGKAGGRGGGGSSFYGKWLRSSYFFAADLNSNDRTTTLRSIWLFVNFYKTSKPNIIPLYQGSISISNF